MSMAEIINEMEDGIKDMQNSFIEIQRQYDALFDENENLEERLETAVDKIADLENQLSEAYKEINNLQSELSNKY